MTYCLFYDARPIRSAVKVVDEGLELEFASGEELQEYKFDIPYRVESITVEDSTIVLHLVEGDMHPDLSWSGGEVSAFDGARGRRGMKSAFDGVYNIIYGHCKKTQRYLY